MDAKNALDLLYQCVSSALKISFSDMAYALRLKMNLNLLDQFKYLYKIYS